MDPDNSELDPCFLCDLPLDVLRAIFSFLDATSLYTLSKTCTYLKECVEDPALWKYINSLTPPHNLEKFMYCTERVYEKTTHLLLGSSGCWLPLEFFPKIKPFENLKILALEYQNINGHQVSMKNFPSTLEELSLRGTQVKANKLSFFHHSWANFPKLRVLILDNCKWATSSVLMSVSKYASLEILSIVKCVKIHRNTLPYLSIAKYGFKKLKVLDCRFTGIGQMVLYTFYSLESIQRLYFQSFNAANLDYDLNFSETARRATIDMSINITDASLHDYGSVISKNDSDKVCNSELYRDPYPKCTCGYQNSSNTPNVTDWPVVEDDIIDSRCGTLKMICKQHRKADPATKPPHLRHFFCAGAEEDDSDSSGSDDEVCCLYGREATVVLMEPLNRDPVHNPNMTNSRPVFIRLRTVNDRPDETPSTSRDSTCSTENSNANSSETQADDEASSSQSQDKTKVRPGPEKRKGCPSDTSDDSDDEPAKKQKVTEREADSFLNSDSIQRIEQLVHTADLRIRELLNDNSQNVYGAWRNRLRNRLNALPLPEPTIDPNPNVVLANIIGASRMLQEEEIPRPSPPHNEEINFDRFRRHVVYPNMPFRLRERWLENRARPLVEKKSSLHRLSLRGYRKITDKGLEYLRHLNMELVDLTYTTVTKEGIENFLVSNPNCRIIHPLYCVCKPRRPC